MTLNKRTAIFLVVALWLTSLCLFMPSSHACCQKEPQAIQKVLPACCVINPANVIAPDQTGFNGPLPNLALSNAPFDYQALLADQYALMQSRTDLAFLADESDRYLELRVLLN